MGILRFILAISVVISHSSPIFGLSFVGGQVAVQSFYIISGFYMSMILNEKYINSKNSYSLFISNRLLRLFPIYWFVLLLTVLSSFAVYLYTNGGNLGRLSIYSENYQSLNFSSLGFLIFTNLFLFGQDVVMFLGLNADTGNLFFTKDFSQTSPPLYSFLLLPQAWTIGVELTFYLIAPFILKRNIWVILAIILISGLLRLCLYGSGLNFDPWTYRFFPTELMFFLLGNISYHIYNKIRKKDISPSIYAGIFILILIFITLYLQLPFSGKIFIYFICFFIGLPFIFKRTHKSRTDIYIGDLSYPVYISHLLILSFLNAPNIKWIHNNGLILSLSTVVFSMLINYFIARPVEIIRQNRIRMTTS